MFNTFIKVFLMGALATILLTGCSQSDGSSSSSTVPTSDKEAQDAMAIHAAIYPVLAPVSEISSCLESTDALKLCIEEAIGSNANAKAIVREGEHNCTKNDPNSGTFTYEKTTNGKKFTFNQCSDNNNGNKFFDQLIVKSCFLGLPPFIQNPDSVVTTYRMEHNGTVECSTGQYSADYTYRTIGNSNNQTKQEWQYKGSASINSGTVSANGSIRGISKYATGTDTPSTPWEDLFVGSDQEWTFEDNTSISLGNDIVLNGKPTYIKHPNDNTGEKGEGYEFYMAFESLVYSFTQNGRDITSTVSGKASASCHPEMVTYATTTTMEDIDLIRDSTHHRMPSSGDMSVVINGETVPVAFSAETSTAQVTTTTASGKVSYANWTAVIDGSSCAHMNDFLDQLPQPPVKNPTAGEIIVDNLVFDNVAERVLAADDMNLTGQTNGRAVWYHLAREQGYTDGQTVEQTTLDFNATGPQRIFVDVYLHDGTDDQYEKIESNADWIALQNDAVKKLWTIRTDYMEGPILAGVFYQGNFILRIGNTDYAGIGESFAINKFLVEKK